MTLIVFAGFSVLCLKEPRDGTTPSVFALIAAGAAFPFFGRG